MMESLGQRFDYFMNVEATKAEQQSVDATLVGIGVNVQLADMEGIINSLPETVTRAEFEKAMTISKGHELTVEGTVEGGPAAAVLKAGDIITHVDGKALDGMQLNDAVKLIRGQEGTTVNLTVERVENGNTQTLQVQVKRAKVKMKVVHTKDLGDGITYVRVDNFMSRTVAQEFAQALQKASTGKGLVIDLRGNPGGELNSVLAMSAMIIPDGTILVTESRESGGLTKNQVIVNRDFVTMVEGNGVQVGPRPPLMVPESMQIVVLIDGGSASASEILSGAIQVHSRGVVMGKPSHGKGVGQSVIDLPFGRRLHVTSFEFLPGGKAMDWIGILPEVEVENDPKQAGDEQLNAGVARLKTMIADEEARQKKSEELKKQNQDNFQKELQQRNQKRSEALSNQR
jgi:carboxyl-terminal processing protease